MASNFKSDTDIRILLIGRTGHGKSSTGNTIIGREIFKVSDASTSETKTCMWSGVCKRFGKTVEVVDTPGMFDTDQHNYAVHKELLRSLALTTPGFHVIAFVLKRGEKFTEEIQNTQDLFFNWFGPGVENFACIILTDTNDENTMNKYLKYKPQEKLTDLVNKCNGRVVPLNNHASCDVTNGQVERILQMAEEIKRTNSNHHFSNVVFKLAEAYAKRKCPKELTMDSIHILETAGLQFTKNKEQCSYFDYVFNIIEKQDSNESAEKLKDHSSDTDEAEHLSTKPIGNLYIYDNRTNNRIYSFTEKNATSTGCCLNTLSDEVQGRRASESDVFRTENAIDYGPADITSPSIAPNKPRKERIHEIIRKTQNDHGECPPEHQSYTESNERSIKVQEDRSESPRLRTKKHSSRVNRKVDTSTVHYDPKDTTHQATEVDLSLTQHNLEQNRHLQRSPANREVGSESIKSDRVNDFKRSINNGEEEINDFLDHLKKLWLKCKKKLRCILL